MVDKPLFHLLKLPPGDFRSPAQAPTSLKIHMDMRRTSFALGDATDQKVHVLRKLVTLLSNVLHASQIKGGQVE